MNPAVIIFSLLELSSLICTFCDLILQHIIYTQCVLENSRRNTHFRRYSKNICALMTKPHEILTAPNVLYF